MTSQRPTGSVTLPAAYVLPALIILLTMMNGFYNSLAVAFGYSFPLDTFVYSAADLLGDFVKAALSFPGPAIEHIDNWSDLYRHYLEHNDYGGAAALAEGKLSNLHGMPLTTLLFLGGVRPAIASFAPNLVAIVFFTAAIAPFFAFILRGSRLSTASGITLLAYLLSYPVIFAVTRGNITAIMLGETLVAASILAWRREHLWLMALLLALAINLRPNAAILLALPLLSWRVRDSVVAGAATLCVAAAIFFAAHAWAQLLYPDYTLGNFFQAVLIYGKLYAVGDAGLAYGSSFLGGEKYIAYVLLGTAPQGILEWVSSLLGIASIAVWLFLVLRRNFERTAALFALLTIYSLFSGVFGDYHLIVFFSFVLIFSQERKNPLAGNLSDRLIAVGVLVALTPKNYVFWQTLSAQIFLNPLLILFCAWGVFAVALFSRKVRPPQVWVHVADKSNT